jgi:hypothetical protein
MSDSTLGRLLFALTLAGGLFAAGCAEGEAEAKKPSADEQAAGDDDDDDDDSDSASKKGEDDTSSSSTKGPDSQGPIPDRTAPTTPTTPTPEPTPEPTPTEPTKETKTGTCTSSTDGSSSVSKLVYSVAGDSVTADSLTVTVTNKDSRNKNDVDVYVTLPGGSEKKIFNSGDILVSGKAVTVPLPSGFSLKLGAKVRLDTNFDSSFFDAHKACTIQL